MSNKALTKEQIERKEFYEQVIRESNKFRTHLAEVKEMCEIINHTIARGYAIQCHSYLISNDKETDAPRLQTDRIEHKFGFYTKTGKCLSEDGYNNKVRYYAVGVAGGGLSCCDVYMDLDGNIWCGNRPIEEYDTEDSHFDRALDKLIRMNVRYDEFKETFWNFINNIEKYPAYSLQV